MLRRHTLAVNRHGEYHCSGGLGNANGLFTPPPRLWRAAACPARRAACSPAAREGAGLEGTAAEGGKGDSTARHEQVAQRPRLGCYTPILGDPISSILLSNSLTTAVMLRLPRFSSIAL